MHGRRSRSRTAWEWTRSPSAQPAAARHSSWSPPPTRAITDSRGRARAVARARRAGGPPLRRGRSRRARADRRTRPDVEIGALHPLQTLPSGALGAARLEARGPRSRARRPSPRSRPSSACTRSTSTRRTARCTTPRRSSRRTTSSRCSVRSSASRRPRASRSTRSRRWRARRSTTSRRSAPPPRSTGPVARGDVATVARHLDALAAAEQDAYRALGRGRTPVGATRRPRAAHAPVRGDAVITVERIADVRARCDDVRRRGRFRRASSRPWGSSTRATVR